MFIPVLAPVPVHAASETDHDQLAEDFAGALMRTGLLPIQRGNQTPGTGVLRPNDGPDAVAIYNHARAWAAAAERRGAYPQEAIAGLRAALEDMTPEDVAGWVRGIHSLRPHPLT